MKTPWILSAGLCSIVCWVAPMRGSTPRLTGAAPLAAAYQQILSARFDAASSELARACPPAPVEACAVLDLARRWWQIQIDPVDRSEDEALERAAAAAIARTRTWTQREPTRAEAWFYHAGALAARAQRRVQRGDRLSAARDGITIKRALERSVALDPELHDAYFGIGLYHYYAAVAPAALKLLRVMMLLPGGDRAQGLAEMSRARDRGLLLASEADYQMHFLYLWYEHDPPRALDLLHRLDALFPTNPVFLTRIATIEQHDRRDADTAARAWTALLERAMTNRVSSAPVAEGTARLGLASIWLTQGDATRAIDVVAPLLRARRAGPVAVEARAAWIAGQGWERLGDTAHAITEFRRAIAATDRTDVYGVRTQATNALRRLRASSRPAE